MGILEELYHEAIYLPETERYKAAQVEAIRLAEELKNLLKSEQFELFESYCSIKSVMYDEMFCESFRQGAIYGAKLERELHPAGQAENNHLDSIVSEQEHD